MQKCNCKFCKSERAWRNARYDENSAALFSDGNWKKLQAETKRLKAEHDALVEAGGKCERK